MTLHADVEAGHRRVANSCLGKSLHRLQHNVNQLRQNRSQDEAEFRAWLKQWSKRSDQIAARLEMIDTHLNDMFQTAEPGPQLRIIDADH